MTSKAEDDVYLSQLRDVFDSCDTSGTGYLGRADLKLLCSKLRLDETADVLGTRLLGEKGEGRVTFDEFKEAFLLVLSETAKVKEDEVSEDSEEELSDTDIPGLEDTFEFEEEVSEVSPKYVKDGKKYGRHSRPGTDTEGDLSEGLSLATCQSDASGATKQKSPGDSKTKKKKVTLEEDLSSQSSSSEEESKPETFEAEGQLNQSISEMENLLDEASEEEHLRAIWRDLGVGKSGSLTISELAVVCEHIGMEEMDQEELGHLFNKLDEDTDGLVSFHEFLRGLFQHSTPATPVPKLTRSASAPRQANRVKLKLSRSASNIEDRSRTPTFFLSSGSGIFSSIDDDHSGFAQPETIIELWDSLNVPQGPEILEYLEFDMNTKINLADLSYVLEQELHSIEEDNATYQAAVATYEHTLHYVKSTQEQANAEINKLKLDLAEANNRITLLVKEGDERHTTLERSRDRELLEVEHKYQKQVKRLQNEGESERDNLLHQTSQQNSRLQTQIDALKRQENELRDNLSLTQKDLERVEKESGEMAERCRQLERQTFRQQKELEATADLQAKLYDIDKHQLEQLELNREVILDESQRFLEEKLKQIRAENQELKDKNDELTMEVEQMRQLLQSARRHLLTGESCEDGESGPQLQRSGSVLSEYTKPVVEKRRGDSVSDTSEDDTGDRPRRKLPRTPSDVDADTDTVEVEELRAEIDGLKREKDEHTREVAKLQRCLSTERLEIEQKYTLEISELEDTYLKEKELIIKTFTKQKEEMAKKIEDGLEVTLREREKELERRLEETLHTQERELERRVEETLKEREEMFQKTWEEEKKEMEEEKMRLINKLKTDHKKELQSKLKEQAERSARELEEAMNRDLSECDALRLQKSEIELRLRLLSEELTLQSEQEKLTLTETWQKERHQLEEEHAAKICNIDNMLSLGADGLKGKLKEDFYMLLERHKEMLDREKMEWQKEVSEQQTAQLLQLHAQEEKQQLQLEEKHKNKIEKMVARERNKLEKAFAVKLETALENEKKELEGAIMNKYKEEFRKREHDLEKVFKVKMQDEKKELEKVIQEKCGEDYQKAKADLERSFKEKFAKMEQSQAESSLRAERSRLEEEKVGLKKKLETDLCHTIERRLEVEFAGQLRKVRAAFEEERRQLLTRVSSLQRELDEAQEERDREQRERKESLEQAQWERRASTVERDVVVERDWNGDDAGEVERLRRTLTEERTRGKKTVDEWEQQCFHLQADHDTIKQELEERQQQLERLRQEPKFASLQKRPSLQSEAGSSGSDREDNYQDELGKLVVERDELRAQLEHTSDMLAESNVALSVSGSEHVRQLAGMHDHMTEVGKYNDLEAELVATQQRLSESEALVEQRAAETNKLLITSLKDQQRILQELQQQNSDLQQRLTQTDSLLEEQVNKLRLQMERSARTDVLLKELYVENAELVTCLGVTEEREKGARTAALRLDEKCRALQRVLRRVVPAAIC